MIVHPIDVARCHHEVVAITPTYCQCGDVLKWERIDVTGACEPCWFEHAICGKCLILWRSSNTATCQSPETALV